jgi:hypothetical protein
VRVGGDDAHVVERGAGTGEQGEPDRQDDLAHDLQRLAVRELVERRGDRALHGVLDRHHRAVGLARAHGVERRRHGGCAVSSPAAAAAASGARPR